jgi:flavin reductase (DIM6/NTAB) family NADH-FMN oxidoreductase RutF
VLNVAPFSYFAPLSSRPPLLGLSINARDGAAKDTLRNLRATGDFVVNLVHEPLLDAMVQASGEWPAEVSEFELTGLTAAVSDHVTAPGVAESQVRFECRLYRELPLDTTTLVIGEIVHGHAADEVMTDGLGDPLKLRAVGRLGGDAYTVVREVLHRPRPRVTPR